MEWLEQVQRDLGGQFFAFVSGNWMLLSVAGLAALLWFFRRGGAGQLIVAGDINFSDEHDDAGDAGDGGGDGGD